LIINYCAIDRIGRHQRKLYCFNLEGKLYFQVGCFFGVENELMDRVNKKYSKDSEYHLAVDFLKKLSNLKNKTD